MSISLFWPKQSYTQRSQMWATYSTAGRSVMPLSTICQGVSLAGVGLDFGPLWVMHYLSDCSVIKTVHPSLSLPVSVPVSLSLPVSRCIVTYCPVVTSSLRAKVWWLRHKFREINLFFLLLMLGNYLCQSVLCIFCQLIHFISVFDTGVSRDSSNNTYNFYKYNMYFFYIL